MRVEQDFISGRIVDEAEHEAPREPMLVAAARGADEAFARDFTDGCDRQHHAFAGFEHFRKFDVGREAEFAPGEVEGLVAPGCRLRVDQHGRDALAAELHEVAVRKAEEQLRAIDAHALVHLRERDEPVGGAVAVRRAVGRIELERESVGLQQVAVRLDEATQARLDDAQIDRIAGLKPERVGGEVVAATRQQPDAAALDQVGAVGAQVPAHFPASAGSTQERLDRGRGRRGCIEMQRLRKLGLHHEFGCDEGALELGRHAFPRLDGRGRRREQHRGDERKQVQGAPRTAAAGGAVPPGTGTCA